ncbi:MAG: MFS transporter [Anaerovoracaceae bacterium]
MNDNLKNEKKIFGWGRYEFVVLIWLFLIWGFVFLDRLVMSFLAPMVIEDLGITDPQYGLINTFSTGCYALAAIVVTPFLEATGKRKKWLILLCLGTGIFACLSAATQAVWQLLIARAAVGFFEGPIAPLMFAMLIKESSPNKVALNPGIVASGVNVIAVSMGPAVLTRVAVASNWRMSFLVAGIASIIVALVLVKVLREVPVSDDMAEGEKKESIWVVIRKLMKNRNVILSFILGILCMCGYWTMMLYATLFFSSAGGRDITSAGTIVSAMGILAIFWTIFVPKVSDFMGRRPAIVMWFALCAVMPFVMFGAPSSMSAVICYALIGGIPGAIFPFFQAIIPGESLPNYMVGTASGLIVGVSEIIGGAAWPAAAGIIAGSNGYPSVIFIAGIAFAAAAITALFLKETRVKNKLTENSKEEK